MKSKLMVLLGGALSLGLVNAASAADMAVKARPVVAPVVVYSWTGCYVGIEGGGIWGSSRHSEKTAGVVTDITNNFDLSGGLVGGTAGCNYQISNFVLGVEGDASWTNKSGSAVDIPPFNTAFRSETKERAFYTLRGRAGVAFDRILFYGTAGAAAADVGITVTGPGVVASENKTVWGWTAGVGVEWAFASNWSAKLEYLHADFGNPTFFDVPPAGFSNRSGGIHLTDDLVRVGVNYKFNWATPVVAKY